MNKLLISLLSLTGVAGISTGSYFLLRNNDKKNEQDTKASSAKEGDSLSEAGETSGSVGSTRVNTPPESSSTGETKKSPSTPTTQSSGSE